MVSRATHYRNTAKHAQRGFGEVKKTLQPRDTDTLWVPEFVSMAQGAGEFGVDSIVALPLGATPEERTARLRQACKLGVLVMHAHRVDGVFVEYRWVLSAEATLA